MEKIIVGFSYPKKWKIFAWLIQTIYGTPYDHVYIKFHSSTYDRDIIYQASKTMINFMGTSVFESENSIYKEFEVEISPQNKVDLMKFAIDNAGKPYSIKEAFGLGIVRIFALFGKKIENPWKDGNDGYVCSILAAYVMENYLGEDIEGDFEDISPKDIYDFLLSKLPSGPNG